MFNGLFSRVKKRVSGKAAVEELKFSPIRFRTRNGGNYPVPYHKKKCNEASKKSLKLVEHELQTGMVDSYSEPEAFDILVHAHFQQARNDVERQSVTYEDAIYSLREIAEADLLKGQREQSLLENEKREYQDNEKKGNGE